MLEVAFVWNHVLGAFSNHPKAAPLGTILFNSFGYWFEQLLTWGNGKRWILLVFSARLYLVPGLRDTKSGRNISLTTISTWNTNRKSTMTYYWKKESLHSWKTLRILEINKTRFVGALLAPPHWPRPIWKKAPPDLQRSSHAESHPPGYFHMTNLLAPHVGSGQDGLVLPEPPDHSVIKKGLKYACCYALHRPTR